MTEKNEYTFNPEDYGYEAAQCFPELKGLVGTASFIKVTAISSCLERPTYWYSSCRKITEGDDRWVFSSSSYQQGAKEHSFGHQVYMGAISSPEYAELLLCHLFGTTKNSGVLEYGLARVKQNINSVRLSGGV